MLSAFNLHENWKDLGLTVVNAKAVVDEPAGVKSYTDAHGGSKQAYRV